MIIKPYIKEFEKMGFGMFLHFGLYSLMGQGEWIQKVKDIPVEKYEKLKDKFRVKKNWAKEIARTAKLAGCRYVTITTRHHDGFSLYDTKGLSDFDAPHSPCGRDLIKEFIEAVKNEGLIPFFYHTLIDWRMQPEFKEFKDYMKYLRDSVEILCRNYGRIGGLWFDGMWWSKEVDWEEDKLYALIRKYQPECMIINNTGLSAGGVLGHHELDSVTFERGRPQAINLKSSPKYIASEMCETTNEHWGCAKSDIHYKSASELIETLTQCRRFGSNFLLNAGPKADGTLQTMDKALFEVIGAWQKVYGESIHNALPSDDIKILSTENESDFILKNGNDYYLFVCSLPMVADPNVAKEKDSQRIIKIDKKIRFAKWLDGGKIKFEVSESETLLHADPFPYGMDYVVRVAKLALY